MSKVTIAIIGSGPAGLSAAARAAALKLDHVVLEKTDHLSDTIFRYQRGKHVMAAPDRLPLRSDIVFAPSSREALLDGWTKQVADARINVRYNAEVRAIAGRRGDFRLTLADGGVVEAAAVVLCIGTAGNPNPLPCPGADLPMVRYQLDDPREHVDERIAVVGGGDAGIENALGLADPELGNKVTVIHRGADFARAKDANVQALKRAKRERRLEIMTETKPVRVEPGCLVVETRDGEARLPLDRVIARLGGAPPRAFLEACGVAFSGPARDALPVLSTDFESSVPGLYVIGALAGYPLIKTCLNQGYDVVERINGSTTLKPADEPLLVEKFRALPGQRTVDEWLHVITDSVEIFHGLPRQQMRDLILEAAVHYKRKDALIFERGEFGSSLFTIVDGSVTVDIPSGGKTITRRIRAGTVFGEIGLLSGRRRSATIRAAENCVLVEVPRTAALKFMLLAPSARVALDRITTERQVSSIFGTELGPKDIADIVAASERRTVNRGESIIREGEGGQDIFLIRSGSMTVSRQIGGKQVFFSYEPAGSYVGEIALVHGAPRGATVTAAIRSEVIRLSGEVFARLLAEQPALRRRLEEKIAERRELNAYIEAQKSGFGSVVDYYTSIANFVVEQGLGEATDALIIDETLCIGCDNCEVACAETHGGISRLDREAGATYAHIHVPTSCRHCEHPHCMEDCPPDAIHRAPDGEVFITDACIGCGNCQRNCPYGVIQMEAEPPKKPGLLNWLLFGSGPGPGQPDAAWSKRKRKKTKEEPPKVAVKCDMCKDIRGGPACVRACPTGAAIRVSPEQFLDVTKSLKQRI